MTLTSDPRQLYSEKADAYERFVRSVGYPQGLRAYFARSRLLRPGLRVLDAGCGTGVLSLAFREASLRRGFAPGVMNAFDITPAMLDRFREKLSRLSREADSSRSARNDGNDGVELAQCDVLHLEELPDSWSNYELIISASMMEYLPRDKFSGVLRALRARLRQDGTLVLFITRRNGLMRTLIGRWWQANLYTADELRAAFTDAGFPRTDFGRFPLPYSYLNLWGYIVEASRLTHFDRASNVSLGS